MFSYFQIVNKVAPYFLKTLQFKVYREGTPAFFHNQTIFLESVSTLAIFPMKFTPVAAIYVISNQEQIH